MEQRRIVGIIPALAGWTATHNRDGEVDVRPLVCWALLDAASGQSVMPMITVGRQVLLCDEAGGTFVGTSPPA